MRDRRNSQHLWYAAGLVTCVGISAVMCDHLKVPQYPVANLHLLFGLLLAVTVAAALMARRRELDQLGEQEFYQYTRRVSRCVYLLLYVLALVRVALQLLDMPQRGVAQGGAPAFTVSSMADFQIYVAYAIVPLWVMRSSMLAIPPASWASWMARAQVRKAPQLRPAIKLSSLRQPRFRSGRPARE